MTSISAYQNALLQIDDAAKLLAADYQDQKTFQKILQKIKTIDKVATATLKITLDSGKTATFKAWRVNTIMPVDHTKVAFVFTRAFVRTKLKPSLHG